jgi:hypothetical protein
VLHQVLHDAGVIAPLELFLVGDDENLREEVVQDHQTDTEENADNT